MDIYVERIVDKVIDGLTKEEVAIFRKKTRKARLQQDHLCTKRRVYERHEKSTIIRKMEKTPSASMKQIVKEVRQVEGFERFSKSTLKRMRVAKALRKRGRKVNEAFESAVLGNLVFAVLQKVDSKESATVIANVAHSYAVIVRAAQDAQKL